ncbi:multisubstrate pseudouridine synthase 7 [Lecanora helva]
MAINNGDATADIDQPEPPLKKAKLEASDRNVAMSDTVENNVQPTSSTAQDLEDAPRLTTHDNIESMPTKVDISRTTDAQDTSIQTQISKEALYGITEYVDLDLVGFSGVTKKRYTDFLVNEILPSGQVVHLDNFEAPGRGKNHSGTDSNVQSTDQLPRADTGLLEDDGIAAHDSADIKQDVSNASIEIGGQDRFSANASSFTTASRQETNDSHAQDSHSTSTKQQQPNIPIEGATDSPSHKENAPSRAQIPLSMQDFDLPAPKEPGELAPHMRTPVKPPTVPLSMQDSSKTQQDSPPRRKKETVRLRQTNSGWVEVNEQEEKEPKKLENRENVGKEGDAIENMDSRGVREIQSQEPVTEAPREQSSQASWQAFASETAADEEKSTDFQLSSEDLTALLSYFGRDTANDILTLHDRILKSPERKARDFGKVISAVIDRDTRSKIHQELRRIFYSRLESSTDHDGAMVITAASRAPTFHARTSMNKEHGHNSRSNRGRNRNNRGRGGHNNAQRQSEPYVNQHRQWAELGGEYLHFSLYKENKDTLECVSWLSRQLFMKPSSFQFAGTKDRRGVTVQRVSVHRVLVERLIHVGKFLIRAKLGNFEYKPSPLQLGELTGNEFVITLRDCKFYHQYPVDAKAMIHAAESAVNQSIHSLATRGFINYYGLQRFGTFSTSTDQVGIRMLQGNFSAAVDGVLHFDPALLEANDPSIAMNDKQPTEDMARAHAINSFKTTGSAKQALEIMPKKFSAERSIIQHLGKSRAGNDFLGAIHSVARNMRLMYVHAYQSLVWNMAASERWKRFGNKVVEGDLVLIEEHKDKTSLQSKAEETDADGEAIVHPSEDDRAADPEDMFIRARLLSKEEAESGAYTIFDIVLPTPGYDIIYPANEVGKFYETFMASERGGGLDPHDMRRKWRDVSMSGSYRKLIARPSRDFSFEIKAYKHDDEQLVETDSDRLEKARRAKINAQHARSAPIIEDPANTENAYKNEDSGDHASNLEANQEVLSPSDSDSGGVSLNGGAHPDFKIAVVLKLQLGSSQYATMALRELMKLGGARTWKPELGTGR